MALAWLSRHRVVVLAGALPAAAATCYVAPREGVFVGSAVVCLVCLAALVALAGYPERPGWRWSWPVGLAAIAPLPLAVAERFAVYIATEAQAELGPIFQAGPMLAMLLLALCVLSIIWLVIDARPAVAMAVFLAAMQLPVTIGFLAMGAGNQVATLYLLVVLAVLAAAVWRLRRQSAHSRRTAPTP